MGMTMLQSFLLDTIAVAPSLLLLALTLWFARRQTLAIRGGTDRRGWMGIVLAVATFAATMPVAQARDDGRYAQSPYRDWFRNLTNQYGIMCCDETDGMRLDDPDWEFDGHGYRVRIDGHWMAVPPQSIVRQRNIMSHAVVWPWKEEGEWRIRCFMAGSGT
jgi:hypothetical protein